jgi:RHS repeat-associated protein
MLVEKTRYFKFRSIYAVQPFVCKYLGEPVDAASGHMASYLEGFSLPGPIPFNWDANYYSDSNYDGPLGKNVYHSYDITLMVNEADQMVIMNDTAGRPVIFPTLEKGQKFFNPIEKYELHRSDEGEYYVGDKKGLFYYFNAPLHDSNKHGQLRTIVNRNSFAIRFAYNRKGHLIQITDSADRIITIENNELGQITALKMLHPELADSGVNFAPVQYEYDGEGRMIKFTNAEGHSNHFVWNKRLITSRTFSNGVTFTFEYDKQERCTAALGPNGLFSYTFAYMDGCTIATNAVGTKKHYYHKDGIVTRIVNSQGAEQLFTYDEYSNLIAESNESGQLKTFTYDDRGNTTQIGLPGQGKATIKYNEHDKPTEVTLPTGALWQYEYNELGSLIKRINPENAATHYEYRRDGLLHSITNTIGAETILQYNSQYLINRVSLPTGASLRYQYDNNGRCTQIHTPAGVQYRWYDLLSNVTRVDAPDGNRTNIRYDSMGNAVHAQDKHGDVTLQYNFFGKVTRRTQGRQSIWFEYDREGQLTEVINEHEERYRFELDSEGNVITETGFDGLSRNYLRDKGGRVIQLTKPDGNKDDYEYNAAGQIITIYHEADHSSEQYDYNKAGQLTKATNADAEVVLERDIMGRITSEKNNNDVINHTYDISGNLLQTISNLGANINNVYDIMGNLVACDAMGWTSEILRDYLGLEIENLLPGNIKNVWQRDKTGKPLLQMVEKRGKTFSNGIKYRKEFAWDADKLMSVTDTVKGGKIHFEYDQFQNLSRTIFGDGEEQLRNPDAIGNLFETKDRRDRKYDKGGRLIKSKNAEYKYDKSGNIIEKKESANRIWHYEWNQAGMLIKVTRPDRNEVTFKYDAFCRRIEKRFKHTITKYVWNGNVLLHEQKLFDARESTADDIITWVFSQEQYTPVAKIKGGKKYSLIADHLGTPTQGYNEEGDLIWNRELDSYGKTRMLKGEEGFCTFTYQGQDYDKDINLTYNRMRWYNHEEGVYCTQDPIRLSSGEYNFYAYVGDPNSWIDIFGLQCSHSANNPKEAHAAIKEKWGHEMSASEMRELQNTIDRIKTNTPNPRHNGKDGSDFANHHSMDDPAKPTPQRLDTGGNYQEWTVRTPGTSNRGERRILVDKSTGKTYYSHDHYQSFIEINLGGWN